MTSRTGEGDRRRKGSRDGDRGDRARAGERLSHGDCLYLSGLKLELLFSFPPPCPPCVLTPADDALACGFLGAPAAAGGFVGSKGARPVCALVLAACLGGGVDGALEALKRNWRCFSRGGTGWYLDAMVRRRCKNDEGLRWARGKRRVSGECHGSLAGGARPGCRPAVEAAPAAERSGWQGSDCCSAQHADKEDFFPLVLQ